MTQYRAEASDQIVARSLDGLELLYHRPSGQTHIVASPVPEILGALGYGPQDPDALYTWLAVDFDLGERDDAVAILTAHLDALVALGLVRAA